MGVHDAVLDNKEGNIEKLADGTYVLTADITDTPAVRKQSAEYNWTVYIVQIDPEYKTLDLQAEPGRLRFELPGAGGGGGGDSDGGGRGDPGPLP